MGRGSEEMKVVEYKKSHEGLERRESGSGR